MDDNFSIYVPPFVENNEVLSDFYKIYEDNCKLVYDKVRNLMTSKGITGETANDLMRTMLPIGVECNLTMGFTIEALIHFMEKRLCVRADAPIRKVAQLMREAVLAVEPRYEEFFIPQCEALMYCPEKHTCGAYPSREEVERLLKLGKDCCKNNPLDEFCNGDCSKCNK